MASTANVSVGKPAISGPIYSALVSANITLPTDATSTLPTGLTSLGFIGEDGVKNSNSPSSEEIKAWGGSVVATPQKEKPDTFTFTMIECANEDVLKTVYGTSNVTTTSGATTITANDDELEDRVWVMDMILTGGTLKRIVVPNAKITEIGEITYKDEEAIGYEVTITCKPDASGNTHYEYIKKN